MDEKTLETLEYFKILAKLAEFCDFPASAQMARDLLPTRNLDEARRLLSETSEAIHLLAKNPGLSIGGSRDVRELVDLAERAGVLDPGDLLDIKYTLAAARNLRRSLERVADQYPFLGELGYQIPEPVGVIDAITRTLSERGDILDSASSRLSEIRRDLRVVHDRLLQRLERMVNDPKVSQYLQEALVTQRDGRYVLPLRAEFKGRVKAIIHDQSSSGATLFVEPIAVVELNNSYKELQLQERDEERRILAELSDLVARNAYEIIHTVDVVATIDLAFARAKFAQEIDASEPSLIPIKPSKNRHPGTVIRLFNARHPLLDPKTVVPIDIELDEDTYAMVITGPNTGGKTVTLKTIGLLTLMAQSGMHIPTQGGSEISLFENIFADIGDEQSIEQSLSTFSGHITNIIRILEQANRRCLVVLDELGAGTDPQEGAALARALLTHLLDRGITTLVTTHHPELKSFANATAGVVNASVEFDLETLQPTYHLTIGLPGRSNALAIAQRLGLPDAIISDARKEIKPEDLRVDDLLDEIHKQRNQAHAARTEAEFARKEAEEIRSELNLRLINIEDERQELIENARRESEEMLDELRKEVEAVRKQLSYARQPIEIIESLEQEVEEIQEGIAEPIDQEIKPIRPPETRSIHLGDRVRLRRLGTQGNVIALTEDEAEVQVGMMRVRTRLSDLELAGREPVESDSAPIRSPSEDSPPHPSTGISDGRPPSPGIEIDLRGQRAEDAQDALERYLERAYLSGLPYVRIIHGKGTGRLRNVVRESLNGHPYVKNYEGGGDNEGGEGVTIAKLKSND